MNDKLFTESFSDFSSRLGVNDLALYAGAAVVVYVLFQDRLKPLWEKVLSFAKNKTDSITLSPTAPIPLSVTTPKVTIDKIKNGTDQFLELIAAWKHMRNLAEVSGCSEAVKKIDDLFPSLSPNICVQTKDRT